MTSYATAADLANIGIVNAAITQFTTAQQQQMIDAVSVEFDGCLAAQYKLPLIAWTSDLRRHVCGVSAYRLMAMRGFNPEDGDTIFRQLNDDAWQWAKDIARGVITPPGIVDSAAPVRVGAPAILTGANGNTVGGNVTPTKQLGGVQPYAFQSSGVLPGQRGW